MAALAEKHNLPSENLLLPDTVRRLAWQPPEPLSPGTAGDALASCGARPWQISLTAEALAGALAPEPGTPAPGPDPS